MLTMLKKTLLLMACAVALLAFDARPAQAYSFNLTTGNSAISPYPGPYATVVVNAVNSTTATITFTALDSSNNLYSYLFGDGGSVGVNVNSTNFTVSGATCIATFTTCTILNTSGGGSEDGFGNFNYSMNLFDGYTNTATQISFTLTNNSGTWLLDGSNVLTANSNGALAAAHIFVADGATPNPNTPALATGYAANGGSQVPDGGMTISLLGLALAGMGLGARRKN